MKRAAIGSWLDVEQLLEARPPGTLLRVPRGWLEHPKTYGMKASAALPLGQHGDYFKRLDENTGLHVADFRDYFIVRRCQMGEQARPSGACRAQALASGAVALGALIGMTLGRSERATLVSAALTGTLIASLEGLPGERDGRSTR